MDSEGVDNPEDNPVMEVLAKETLDPICKPDPPVLSSMPLRLPILSPALLLLPLASMDRILLTRPLPPLFFLSKGSVCVLEKLLACERLVLQTGAV